MSTRVDSIRMARIYGGLTFRVACDAVDAYLDRHPNADTSEVIAAALAELPYRVVVRRALVRGALAELRADAMERDIYRYNREPAGSDEEWAALEVLHAYGPGK